MGCDGNWNKELINTYTLRINQIIFLIFPMKLHSMKKFKGNIVITEERVIEKIYVIRGERVMLDNDLAKLYGVETRRLNEQVKRNMDRFPLDFMFQLTREEFINLKSQTATSSWGGRRTLPFAFSEHGVLMLSSVLNSEMAIKVNIQIMRVYTKIRNMLSTHKEILRKFEKMESKIAEHDDSIMIIMEYLKRFEDAKREELAKKDRRKIGYKP